MVTRSKPYTLLYEGVLQRLVKIEIAHPLTGVYVYGLTTDNVVVGLGELVSSTLITQKLGLIWYELDNATDIAEIDNIQLIIDGEYAL